MNKSTRIWWILVPVLVVAFGALVFWLVPRLTAVQTGPAYTAEPLGYSSQSVQGEVITVLEEGKIQLGEVEQTYQILDVEVLEGEYQGLRFQVEYGRQQLRPEGLALSPGDRIILAISRDPENQLRPFFQDFVRTGPLLALFATFVVFSILISGWKGFRGLIGMGFSIGVVIWYIIPQILAGKDPVLISVSGAFILLSVTLYLVYGWNWKTHAAVAGTLLSLILTAFLARYFVNLTRLTGFGSEEALFLLQQTSGAVNLQGLVLGGMLIGALGVLDDLVITQASVVFELFQLDPDQDFQALFRRSMRVGQDHVAATVNTLVLAYAGASLPLLMLFSIAGTRVGYWLNLEYVAEEVVRTMVGSLGLIAAVPLTTLLSVMVAKRYSSLGSWRRWFGPLSSGGSHGHSH